MTSGSIPDAPTSVRHVIIGAGGVGGVIAGRLVQHGTDVLAVARGEHFRAIAANGLTLRSPGETAQIDLPVVEGVENVAWREDDVVLLAVKSQDTLAVLSALAPVAPPTVAVVCAQNGVENERVALRLFSHVYGLCVMLPATHLAPGSVEVHAGPVAGVLDLGCWPSGSDAVAHQLAATLETSGFRSEAREDIAMLKWGKLLSNLGNAVQALCGLTATSGEVVRVVRAEAVAVLAAHGVDAAAAEAALVERVTSVGYRTTMSSRAGGSTWQSLARGSGVETDYLNGEIALLGRIHGVPTPANELLQRRTAAHARAGGAPGTVTEAELLSELATSR